MPPVRSATATRPRPGPVLRTAQLSLAAQVVVGLVTAGAFAVPRKPDDLDPILALELSSQVVEFAYYAAVVGWFGAALPTWTRYLDWAVSTPIMLLSTALFLRHRGGAPSGGALAACLLCNWAMLACGFAVERGRADRLLGLAFGGAAFVLSFTALSLLLDAADGLSLGLFWAMYVVWGLYGVAAGALDEVRKNVAYNALDVVSKNFYGLFLFAYVLALPPR
jgi:hypothetical protein